MYTQISCSQLLNLLYEVALETFQVLKHNPWVVKIYVIGFCQPVFDYTWPLFFMIASFTVPTTSRALFLKAKMKSDHKRNRMSSWNITPPFTLTYTCLSLSIILIPGQIDNLFYSNTNLPIFINNQKIWNLASWSQLRCFQLVCDKQTCNCHARHDIPLSKVPCWKILTRIISECSQFHCLTPIVFRHLLRKKIFSSTVGRITKTTLLAT